MTTEPLSARTTATGVRLDLRVMPRAPKDGIGEIRAGRLVMRVTAPPVDQAANAAVVALLAEALALPKRAIRLVSGEAGRNKTVEIDGITLDDLRRRLGLQPRTK